MEYQTMTFLLLACGSLSEGSSRQFSALPGVNSRKGNTREAQTFHCTNAAKDSTVRWKTTESVATACSKGKHSATSGSTYKQPKSHPNGKQSTHDPQPNVRRTEITTKQLPFTPTKLPEEQEPHQTTKHHISTPPISPHERTKPLLLHQPIQWFISTPTASPPCMPNMVLGPGCDCDKTCQNPTSCSCAGPETCVCRDGFVMESGECVPDQTCKCYYKAGGFIIPEGGKYVNGNCSERCTCSENQLNCNSAYTCSLNAACRLENGVRRCYCNDGYEGDGESCKPYTDCYEVYQAGNLQNGIYFVRPFSWPGDPFQVYCNMSNDGGWTVFQRRTYLGITTFNRNWTSYRQGFGDLHEEFWLGNEKLFYLTEQKHYRLRIDYTRQFSGDGQRTKHVVYQSFNIGTEFQNYVMGYLGEQRGTAGDFMRSAEGNPFSTYDRGNDGCGLLRCSKRHGGAGWWFSNELCTKCKWYQECDKFKLYLTVPPCYKQCTTANPNGKHQGNTGEGIFWNDQCSINYIEMKLRPVTHDERTNTSLKH